MKVILPIPDPEHPEKETVARLHGALAALWGTPPGVTGPTGAQFDDFTTEREAEKYGTITRSLVKEFRASAGLPPVETLEASAAAQVNNYLLKKKMVGKIAGILRDASLPVDNGTGKPSPLKSRGVLIDAYNNIVQSADDKWPLPSVADEQDSFVICPDFVEPENARQPEHLLVFVRDIPSTPATKPIGGRLTVFNKKRTSEHPEDHLFGPRLEKLYRQFS